MVYPRTRRRQRNNRLRVEIRRFTCWNRGQERISRSQAFFQVARYARYFDAVFLAYPSDAAAEALYLSEAKKANMQVGILALTLYRTHVVRRAEIAKRTNDEVWQNRFDETKYWKDWENSRRDKTNFKLNNEQRLTASALLTKGFWSKVDKSGRRTKRASKIDIPKSAWRFVAIVYALSDATSIYRMHSKSELDDLFFRRMKWGYMNWGDALKAGLIYSREYGSRLSVYNLEENVDALRPELERALKANLGTKDWNKIQRIIEELRKQHSEERKQRFEEYFRLEN
jgi:hypothetical protein